MYAAIGLEQAGVFRGYGRIRRNNPIHMQTLRDGILNVDEDSEARSRQQTRTEARIARRRDRDLAVEHICYDLAPYSRTSTATDEEYALHRKLHLLERTVAVLERERHALHKSTAEIATLR